MSTESLSAGARVGAYEILEPLGAGGMGEVYRARDPRLEREVALKVLPGELTKDPDRLRRFRREAKALAALNHPHIVTIYEVGEADGVPFLAMELVQGETLDRLLPAGGLSLQRFFDLAIPLADAVAAAHERGVIHRDLKPENVMVTEDDLVKVLDFGLARRDPDVRKTTGEDLPTVTLDVLTREGTLLGTAPYMSPEQIQGKPVDARSDVFSLGILLHEMITGRRPFSGEDPPSLVSSILRDEPPPLQRIRPEVPRHLDRILALCLAKRPTRRIQSARDLRNQLVQLRGEVERSLEEPAPGDRPSHAGAGTAPDGTPWRKWKIPALVAASLSIVLMALVWWWIPGGTEGPEPRSDKVSIAVLPLDDLSGDPNRKYFADGMTEALITSLARIDELHVISRSSVVGYEDSAKPGPEIARELGVQMLLEGTVLRAGDRVRITAQLIDAAEDRHLWAESYERDLRDILSLQGEVAREVARQVAVELSPEDAAQLTRGASVDPEAYEAFLKGQYRFSFYRSGQDVEQALEHFQAAAELDPSFAPAQVGISKSLAFIGYIHGRDPRTTWDPARTAAERALDLDNSLAEAWVARGRVQLMTYDWGGAEASLARALELSPNNFDAHDTLSLLFMALGEDERNLAAMRRALTLDPLSAYSNARLAWSLYMARRHQEATEHLRHAMELHPGHGTLELFLVENLTALGRSEAALEVCEGFDRDTACMTLYAKLGMDRRTREALEQFRQRSSPPRPAMEARTYAQLGDLDRAFEKLEAAWEMESADLIMLGVEPFFDPLRDDARYRDLLERLGLAGLLSEDRTGS